MPVIEFLLKGVCHQYAEHCLVYGGRPLPICARCTGTFLGVVGTLVTLWASGEGRRDHLPSSRTMVPLLGLVLLWVVDGLNSTLHSVLGTVWLYEPSNALRLITGVGVGLTVGVVIYPAYHLAFWKDVRHEPVLEDGRHRLILSLMAASLVTVLLLWRGAPAWLVVTVTTGSVVVVLSVVNALLIALLRHGRGFATHWVQVLPYLGAGLAAALVEMGTMATLRWLVERATGI